MIEFNNVFKTFNKHVVLDYIDLTIASHETTGLIGANGEGKTTLFKCLLDACHLDAGEIHISGIPHTNVQARSYLAFLPEHFQAPFFLNGIEFLQMMMALHDTPFQQHQLEGFLSELLFDIKLLNKPVRTFSKGMMQKLGLTACLCSDKPIVILDEPMSGLDPAARYALKKKLLQLKEQGKTLIFSTHLLHDIESICDRIVILSSGHIQYNGTVADALSHYQSGSLEQAYLNCLAA